LPLTADDGLVNAGGLDEAPANNEPRSEPEPGRGTSDPTAAIC